MNVMTTKSRNWILALIGVCAACWTASAGEDHHCGQAKIKLDSLKAELFAIEGGWQLAVKYKVESEDGPLPGPLALTFQLQECGQFLVDEAGQPITLAIQLERPTKCDDDEIEFKGRVAFDFPSGAVRCPNQLRIFASVGLSDSNQTFDRKNKSVKLRCPDDCNESGGYINIQIGGW